jgi:hypothetical protein
VQDLPAHPNHTPPLCFSTGEMSVLRESGELQIQVSESIVGFEQLGPDFNPNFDRYLTIGGERAYHMGNICGTCDFVFERLKGANQKVSPAAIGDGLRRGVHSLADELVATVAGVLPRGAYRPTLLEVTPMLVQPGGPADYFTHEQVELFGIDTFWSLPHDPRTEYYRDASPALGHGRQLFEFVVPMVPSSWLRAEAVAEYEDDLNSSEQPTAFALSVLDVKGPANWQGDPPVTEHWCLVHYLLDGHHKMHAAARTRRPVTLLSFLATGESIATSAQIEDALRALTPS